MRASLVVSAVLVVLALALVTPRSSPVQAAAAEARAAQAANGPTADALSAHARRLEKRLAGRGLTVVVEAPFVVVGDEKPDKVRARASSTVRWAVRLLRQDFFDRDPGEIIEVWLFKNEQTYRKGAKKYFDDEPSTPYGYYSPSDRAMIMNIGPGAGTLVHELVHPYMEANFPAVPAWFNEGLASLYEYPVEVKGHIRGRINWRLRGLKQELKGGHRRSFASLTATTSDEFYGAADDTYAQARYLVYYLQEQGLLREYYRRFRAGADKDPTGYQTLQQVLGVADMDRFHADWVRWVMKLPEP